MNRISLSRGIVTATETLTSYVISFFSCRDRDHGLDLCRHLFYSCCIRCFCCCLHLRGVGSFLVLLHRAVLVSESAGMLCRGLCGRALDLGCDRDGVALRVVRPWLCCGLVSSQMKVGFDGRWIRSWTVMRGRRVESFASWRVAEHTL